MTNTIALKFALIQSGYCVFGVGSTRDACLIDACQWLESNEDGAYTPDRIENELIARRGQRVDGDFYILDSRSIEFDNYLENQGGFEKRNDEWFVC